MPTSSKAEYLSKKYLGDSKKKKKKKKDRCKSAHHPATSDDSVGDPDPFSGVDWPGQSSAEEEDGDGPIVVQSHEISSNLVDSYSNTTVQLDVRQPLTQGYGGRGEPEATTSEPRRKRYDSTSSSSEAQGDERKVDTVRKRRYDSSDEEEHGDDSSRPRRQQRYDSSDEEQDSRRVNLPTRQRLDSSDSSSNSDNPSHRRRQRLDSDDDSASGSQARRTSQKRQRYDSDDQVASDDDHSSPRNRLASGHKAGLQSSTEFAQQQSKALKQSQQLAQATVDKHGMGETVYRDKHGRKQSARSLEDAEKEAQRKAKLAQQAQLELIMGTKQKEALLKQQAEMSQLATSGFARYADDDALEAQRKAVIREGDPMAAHAVKSTRKGSGLSQDGVKAKRVYSGPPPKPNRYGIRPGFRWDGIDRGNGFEDRLLARQYMKQHQAEQAQIWSTRDM